MTRDSEAIRDGDAGSVRVRREKARPVGEGGVDVIEGVEWKDRVSMNRTASEAWSVESI